MRRPEPDGPRESRPVGETIVRATRVVPPSGETAVVTSNGAVPCAGVQRPVTSCEWYESGMLAALEATLIDRCCPPLRPEDVQRCVVASVVRFADARVHAYLTLLIEREAMSQLRELIRLAGGAADAGVAEVGTPSGDRSLMPAGGRAATRPSAR